MAISKELEKQLQEDLNILWFKPRIEKQTSDAYNRIVDYINSSLQPNKEQLRSDIISELNKYYGTTTARFHDGKTPPTHFMEFRCLKKDWGDFQEEVFASYHYKSDKPALYMPEYISLSLASKIINYFELEEKQWKS